MRFCLARASGTGFQFNLQTLLVAALVLNPAVSFCEPAGLSASGPAREHADKLMLFGQFVGDWEFDYTFYPTKGDKQTFTGEWHFGWILEGRAVQDTWIFPRRAERNPDKPTGEYGTTVRFYDAKIDAWRVVWSGPMDGEMSTFIARPEKDEIVMTGNDNNGQSAHWIFSKITKDSFYWHSHTSSDGGKTWKLTEEMFVRRSQ